MSIETKNAIIEKATIDSENGVLMVWLFLDYGGTNQGFGGYATYLPKSYKHHEIKSVAGHFIWRCMEVAGVSDWGRVVGRTIRVKADHNKVIAIGHIIKDDWFDPAEDFEASRQEGGSA